MSELVAASIMLVTTQLKQAHKGPTVLGLVFCISEGVQVLKKKTDLALSTCRGWDLYVG